MQEGPDGRPNIIIIVADDLGFSDVSCFGSEIDTPSIDSLARSSGGGVRFTQMYNCARCCPSRASLLTGAYPHRAGIGHMVSDAGVGEGYQGYLRRDVDTVAEMLGGERGGYATFAVGKWHVGGEYPPDAGVDWVRRTMGGGAHPTPEQRGFDSFYGTLGGGGSYYRPPSLVRDGAPVSEAELPGGYYYTDAISDEACAIIEGYESGGDGRRRPFFMYVAHVAPHWYVECDALFAGLIDDEKKTPNRSRLINLPRILSCHGRLGRFTHRKVSACFEY